MISAFFKKYLAFLRKAGHYVLFGFPDFTDQKVLASLPVDYAILHRDQTVLDDYCRDITYFNITKEQIEIYVRETQYERANHRAEEKNDTLAESIAKIRWTKDSVFYDVTFDLPIVKPLCPHEALFILQVKEVKQVDQ